MFSSSTNSFGSNDQQPAGFSFGSSSATATTDQQQPSFGTTGNTSGGFSFGETSQPATTQQPTGGFSFGSSPTTTTTTTGFGSFGSQPATQPSFGFGTTTGNSQPTTTGFGLSQLTTTQSITQPPQTGFGFGATQPPTVTGFGATQPQQTGFAFGTTTTEPTFGFTFGAATTTNLAGFITIPQHGSFGGYQSNDFHDLNIEIYDENGLFTTIKTHRIKVGQNNGLLSQLVKNSTKKNDVFTIELATSFIPESKFGRIKAIALQHAISSYFESSNAKVEDILQVMLVMDYFGIPTFQTLVNRLYSTFKLSEYCARAYLRSFNNFFSTYSLPHSTETSSYFTLFKIAFNTLVDGKDLENQMVIKELNRQLFETQIKKVVTATELPNILSAIDVWVLHNFASLRETLSYEVCTLVDNLHINNIETVLMMIQLLSCNSPQFYFISAISPEWKLKLINKYASCNPVQQPQAQPGGFNFVSTPVQTQQTQQTPFGFG
ncbi:nucleoporin nup98 [Naegleria gruberi]|uniref:Nucleoporin nup98 n=1 Tax=Naegleria gruberi TaxID=5762 RepID=D2VET4_NAEGR|nr:nucleoporin nup98 [Naegleria gruberi]EFC44658.1 nucleoporin nup98 [Naegleria gruberi]|eukprot:XP_002677402.1 nucleoporin nup98 [Naegleria gruberi strain NEG-M]